MTSRVLVLMGLPCLWLLATEARAESHDADGSNAERQLGGQGSVDAGAPAATELPAGPDFEAPRELKPEWNILCDFGAELCQCKSIESTVRANIQNPFSGE